MAVILLLRLPVAHHDQVFPRRYVASVVLGRRPIRLAHRRGLCDDDVRRCRVAVPADDLLDRPRMARSDRRGGGLLWAGAGAARAVGCGEPRTMCRNWRVLGLL